MFLNKHTLIMRLIFLAVFFIGLSVSSIEAKDTCVECHKDIKFRTQNPVLFNYYANWKDSTHDIEDITCKDCHGGDPTKGKKEDAHKGNYSSLSSIDNAAFKKIPQRCGECHKEVLKNFVESKHYEALIEKGTGPHCATCHGSVNADVYYTSVISRACKDCHNEYTKNRPEIVGEADKILHRINVAQAYKKWILINYEDKEMPLVMEMLALYSNVTESWHKFNFKELDQKSQDLLSKMKSLRNLAMAEKRKKTKNR